ncbi:hypothetical protein [Streptomyces sp. NK08204]|uniref:hypothetical protein n=1 Tax=Streptomyces sp. NK08204 TaxID=2873260 RepID=UPI001CEC68AE|nr:hypothetical protein [Streptomyces sp. NK08204]
MTDRIPLDHLTSDALDALYEQLEAAEATEAQRQLATARDAFASATTRSARAEAELARLRQVARGYCPACGRGDAAPTVQDWEQQRQRADHLTTEITALRDDLRGITGARWIADMLDTILNQPAPAATQATDNQEQPRV